LKWVGELLPLKRHISSSDWRSSFRDSSRPVEAKYSHPVTLE
jgi:hypothetical protein